VGCFDLWYGNVALKLEVRDGTGKFKNPSSFEWAGRLYQRQRVSPANSLLQKSNNQDSTRLFCYDGHSSGIRYSRRWPRTDAGRRKNHPKRLIEYILTYGLARKDAGLIFMRFDIVTIFPELFKGFLTESLLARAQKKKLLSIKAHDLRKWTTDKHKTVDDRPYGGGAGMVLKVEPLYRAVSTLKSKVKSQKSKVRTILLSAKGKTFTQKDARRLAKYDQLIMICGRYEGVDERVAKHVADEEISIGNFVLFGGEVPAMVVIEAVSRLISGVVAKSESVKNESFSDKESKTKEYPQYTRPEIFRVKSKVKSQKSKVLKVPKVLLSGDHKKIAAWREAHQASLAPKGREERRRKHSH